MIRAQGDTRLHHEYNLAMKNKSLRRIAKKCACYSNLCYSLSSIKQEVMLVKLTLQKIFFSILAIAVSIAAAVIGMYMVFLAEMLFTYRMLFACVFMFNPILTGFLISFAFRKSAEKEPKEPKQPKEPKESKWGWKKDKEESAASAAEQANTSVTGSFDSTASSGYDLPGSEVYTNYSDSTIAGDISDTEAKN